MKSPEIEKLNKIGQSIWCDNLSRSMLLGGELKRLVDAGVSGLTSNPTIFNKAITGSSDYDKDVRTLAKSGKTTEEVAGALFVDDVGGAADLLRPIYDATNKADGYASVEVSPTLAYDTAGTVAAGRRLWKSLARPNVMIKVPATAEGIPAIKTLLDEGINVNITLIFSVTVYEKVMNAYFSALEARVARKEPIDSIASVASFFVSRVDSISEKALAMKGDSPEAKQITGKVGIANSKLAYSAFLQTFNGGRWAALSSKGARYQRPLWASTGTKNPSYSPVLYVDALAAAHTVNTLPPQTLDAVLKGVSPELKIDAIEEAQSIIGTLEKLGINFPQLLIQLEKEGVDLFAQAYTELLKGIETKR